MHSWYMLDTFIRSLNEMTLSQSILQVLQISAPFGFPDTFYFD